MEDYEQLLKKAEEELPEQLGSTERFVIEKVRGHVEGNKTVLVNIKKISKDFERDPQHLLKYLLRELATPGKFSGDLVIFGAKVPASIVNNKIKKYASDFVYCSECSKPDTKLVEEKGITFLHCQACGAKRPVKRL